MAATFRLRACALTVALAATRPPCAEARRAIDLAEAPGRAAHAVGGARRLISRVPRGGFEDPVAPHHPADVHDHVHHDIYGHTEDDFDPDHHDIVHHAGDLPEQLKTMNLFMCQVAGDQDPAEAAKQALAFDRFMREYFRNHVLDPLDRFAEALNYICAVEHLAHPEDEDGGVHKLCDETKAVQLISDTREALEVFEDVKKEWAAWAVGKQVGPGKAPIMIPDGLGPMPRAPSNFDLNPYIVQHLARAKAEAAAADAKLPARDMAARAHRLRADMEGAEEPSPDERKERGGHRRHRHAKMRRFGARPGGSMLKRWFGAAASAASIFAGKSEVERAEFEQMQRVVDAAVKKDPALRLTHVLQREFMHEHIHAKVDVPMFQTKYATGLLKDGGVLLGPGVGYKNAAMAALGARLDELTDTGVATIHLGDVVEHVSSFHELMEEAMVPTEVKYMVKSAATMARQEYDPRHLMGGAIVGTDEVVTHGGHSEFLVVEDLLNLASLSDTVVSATASLKAYVKAKAKLALLKGASAVPILSAAAEIVDESTEAELVPEAQVMMDLVKGSDAVVRLASLWSRLPKELCHAMKHNLHELNEYVMQLQAYLHHLH